MNYRVHRCEVNLDREPDVLQAFLNELTGDVVAVFPHMRKPSLAWLYGLKRSVDFVVVVERLA